MNKPRIFIGSSVEGLNIAYAVQQNLTHDAEITVWDQGVFELSQTTIESLITVLEKSDFAIFVFSPDDITKIRTKQYQTVRDNVIFELGMFIGKLGRSRSFIIMPDKPIFHIPTDLLGVTAGKYDTSRADGSYQAATGPVCHQIRAQVRKMGLLEPINNEATAEKDMIISQLDEVKKNDWWSYYVNEEYDKAIEFIEKEIANSPKNKNDLDYWKVYMEYKINPQEGKKVIKEKLLVESDSLKTYLGMTRILLWEDELDLAYRTIEAGLSKFKGNISLIYRKSEYLEKIGKIEDAISLLYQTNYEDNEKVCIQIADLYEKLEIKKSEEAFLLISKLYLKNSSSTLLAFKLGKLAQDTNRESLALHLFDKLTKKHPDNIEYWAYLGNACLDLGLNNKAMIMYRKANEVSESKEGWILSNIGNLLMNKGFFAEAKEYFKNSLTIDPDSEYNFRRLASIIKSEEEENEKYSKFLIEGLSTINELVDS